MIKKIMTSLLAIAMVMSLSIIGFAADINESGQSSSVPLDLSISAATFSVAVPSSLPIELMSDGTVEVATNSQITNNSQGQVQVTDISIETANSWTLVSITDDFANKMANSREFGISINGVDAATGDLTSAFQVFAANSSQDLKYDVKVAPQIDNSNNGTIGYLVVTMGWVEIPKEIINFRYVSTLNGELVYFQAEEGMTWEQFINSDYNVDDYFYIENGEPMGPDGWRVHNVMNGVELTDEIMADWEYISSKHETPEDS